MNEIPIFFILVTGNCFSDTIISIHSPGAHCKAYSRLLSASLIYIIRPSPLSTPGPHHFRLRLLSQHTLYYSDVTLHYLPCGAVRGAQLGSRGHLMTALARVRRRCEIGIWRGVITAPSLHTEWGRVQINFPNDWMYSWPRTPRPFKVVDHLADPTWPALLICWRTRTDGGN